MAKIVSIDPSINRVGWAMIDGLQRCKSDGTWDGSEAKWTCGYWDIGSIMLSSKLKEIVDNIIISCDGLDGDEGDHLVVEWPQYFDVERGQIAAREGHTLNLAAINTYIAGYFRLPSNQWHPVLPSQWKGNITKEMTRRRFFRELGQKKIYKVDHNTVDAVMMLLDFCKKKRVTNRILNLIIQGEAILE